MKLSVATFTESKKKKNELTIHCVYESKKSEFTIKGPWQKHLCSTAKQEDFTGKSEQALMLNTLSDHVEYVALAGLGDKKKAVPDTFRKIGAQALRMAMAKNTKNVAIVLPADFASEQFLKAALEGFLLADYRFDKYITEKKPERHLKEACFYVPKNAKSLDRALKEAKSIAHGVCYARDLVNEGPAAINPPSLAKLARKEGKAHGLNIKVLDEKDLAQENMNLMLAVGRASADVVAPCLIKMTYKPSKKAKKHIVLVGKGVTFDSGGLDLKPPDAMLDMKIDMSGAAAVFGTMLSVGQIKPDVAVTGYLVCVENGIGSKAFHPGDVLKSRKGLTVEVNNTDAEGRLILADALDYAQDKDNPDYIIDLATLTGACMVALGPDMSALFSNDDKLTKALSKAGQSSGEDYWPLPLNEKLRDQLQSNVADMKNTGTRYGGSITAALFLKSFIKEKTAWAHLDIAGPATSDKDSAHFKKGGTGFGVRTLVQFIDQL